MTNTKPQLGNALPKEEQWNGLPAIEAELVHPLHAGDVRVAVVKYRTARIVKKVADGDVYPVLEFTHFEPIRSQAGQDAAQELLRDAWQERTGEEEMPDATGPDTPLDMPIEDSSLGDDGV